MSHIIRVVNIKSGEAVIVDKLLCFGRLETCEIRIPDKSISRQHATIELLDSGCIFTDKGSSNGSLINGASIQGSQKVIHGDKIQIGEHVFEVQFSTLPSPASDPLPENRRSFLNPIILCAELLGRASLSGKVPDESLSRLMGLWSQMVQQLLKNHQGKIFAIDGDAIFTVWETPCSEDRLKVVAAAKSIAISYLKLNPEFESVIKDAPGSLRVKAVLHTSPNKFVIEHLKALLRQTAPLDASIMGTDAFLAEWIDAPEIESPKPLTTITIENSPIPLFAFNEI